MWNEHNEKLHSMSYTTRGVTSSTSPSSKLAIRHGGPTHHRGLTTAMKVFCINTGASTSEIPKADDTQNGEAVNTEELATKHREMQRKQVNLIVKTSKDCYIELKASINKANGALAAIKHQRHQIDNDLLIALEQLLVGKTATLGEWVLDGLDQLEEDQLEIASLIENDTAKQQKIDELMSQLDNACNEPKVGFSEKFELAFWDCETVRELSFKMASLQKDNHNLLAEVKVWKQATGIATKRQHPKAIAYNEVYKAGNKSSPFQLENSFIDMRVTPKSIDVNMIPKEELHASHTDRSIVEKPIKVNWPMPSKFTGKTRGELERYFVTFESSTDRNGIYGDDKAELLANYLPSGLQQHHYNIYAETHDYGKVKSHLLNALGSENSVRRYTFRTGLDRMRKNYTQSYSEFFYEVENKVAEAFAGDKVGADEELKKILIRVTQNDRDLSYYNLVITQSTLSYLDLKELVLSLEDTRKLTATSRYPGQFEGNKRLIGPKNDSNNFTSNTNNHRFLDGRENNNHVNGNRDNGHGANMIKQAKVKQATVFENCDIRAAEDVFVPPNSVAKIRVLAPHIQGPARITNNLNDVKLSSKRDIQKGYTSILYTNLSEERHVLQKNQVIGKAFPLKRNEIIQHDWVHKDDTSSMYDGEMKEECEWNENHHVDAETCHDNTIEFGHCFKQPFESPIEQPVIESAGINTSKKQRISSEEIRKMLDSLPFSDEVDHKLTEKFNDTKSLTINLINKGKTSDKVLFENHTILESEGSNNTDALLPMSKITKVNKTITKIDAALSEEYGNARYEVINAQTIQNAPNKLKWKTFKGTSYHHLNVAGHHDEEQASKWNYGKRMELNEHEWKKPNVKKIKLQSKVNVAHAQQLPSFQSQTSLARGSQLYQAHHKCNRRGRRFGRGRG